MDENSWKELDCRVARDLISGVRCGFITWEPTQFSAEEYVLWVQ